jgi:hypothetical protein
MKIMGGVLLSERLLFTNCFLYALKETVVPFQRYSETG